MGNWSYRFWYISLNYTTSSIIVLLHNCDKLLLCEIQITIKVWVIITSEKGNWWLILFELLFIGLSSIIIVFTVPFTQATLLEINPSNFRRIKISKFKWLFRTIGSKDSIYSNLENFGIPIPIFILHLFGYLIFIASVLLYVILQIIGTELRKIATYAIYIWFTYIAVVVIAYTSLIIISKKREN